MAAVHPLEPDPTNANAAAASQPETIGRKRQRRPSVRLGDIGGNQAQIYDAAGAGAHPRRRQFRAHGNQSQNLSDSRTRALTNLAGTLGEEREFNLDIKRQVAALPAAAKRPRSNWAKDSKFEDTAGNGSNGLEDREGRDSGKGDVAEEEEEEEDGYSGKGFNVEDSESPIDCSGRKDGGFSRLDGVELSGPSDNDAREYGNDNVGCSGRGGGEDAVRVWLNSIGLGRYAPVFEVHEVDDEVLPMLTLEDLKDMGISAVGSRRKMFCAIQKLGRGFS